MFNFRYKRFVQKLLELTIRCPKSCKNRFRGCHCAKSQCRSHHCQCFVANRECDADVCRNCWISIHLQGLLSGPWLNPHFPMIWRKNMLGVANFASLKILLLKMESNLHSLTFSIDWQKHVDGVKTVGSAYHVVISSARLSLKHGIGRKRANPSKVETSQSSNVVTGWQGFPWKVLPQSLASKAACPARWV